MMQRRDFLAGATGMMAGLALGEAAEAGTVWPIPDWETASPESQGMTASGLAALKAFLEEHGTRSALVVHSGRVVGEWFWEGSRADTQFPVYSITKSFTATAIGFLAADGKLALDQPAADFIPEWRVDDRKGVTVRHLLTMSSGMSKDEATLYKSEDKIGFALTQPLQAPPGTKWDYNNVGASALSRVVAAASGMEMSRYLEGKLYAPIGISHFSHEEPAGHTLPYSGLRITARDLARFGYLYLNGGIWKTRLLLPASFIGEATSTSQKLNNGYGFLWWVNTAGQWPEVPHDAYAARGAFGNELLILPGKNLMVVRMVGDKPNAGVDMNRMGTLALAACQS
jgi:CubicO group peptidase (beta-lactamase class C family)